MLRKTIGVSVMLSLMCSGVQARPLSILDPDFYLKILGKFVFFDEISEPQGEISCASCHAPETGGTHPNQFVNLGQVGAPGAVAGTSGGLKPPSNTYASFAAPFHACTDMATPWCGGNFYNGRSVGFGGEIQAFSTVIIGPDVIPDRLSRYSKYLGPTADQALNPFLNPVEHNSSALAVCQHVARSAYQIFYTLAWRERIDCRNNLEVSFQRLGIALAAYQSSSEINSFSSKFDSALALDSSRFLRDRTPGQFPLGFFSDEENLGHDLFYGVTSELNPTGKNAQCAVCHTDNPGSDDGTEEGQLFRDDSYHNIGVPKNNDIVNPESIGSEGLAGHLGDATYLGYRRTPTLRNVDKRPARTFAKAYTANGWFKSLESLVHFYNTADTRAEEDFLPETKLHNVTTCPSHITREEDALANNCWPEAEFPEGSARGTVFIGNLGLTDDEEKALVAYLKTLTDNYTARTPF